MRYARFRSDRPVRVLGNQEESQLRNRSIIEPGYDDDYYMDYDGADDPQYEARANARAQRGTTVREYRQRQRKASKSQSKIPARLLVIVLVLVVVLVAGFAVYRSPLFAVQQIEVEGAQHLTVERIKELAAIPQDTTLLRMNLDDIKARIEADTWVESATIHRSFPSTVIITVTERKIAAIVEIPSQNKDDLAKNWLISQDGFWLGSYDPQAVLAAEEAAAAAQAAQAEAEAAEAAAADEAAAESAAGGAVEGAEGAAEEAAESAGDATDGAASDEAQVQAEDSTVGQDSDQSSPGTTPIGEISIIEGISISPSEVRSLPHIKEIAKSADPLPGRQITDEGVINALTIVNGCSSELLGLIQSISAPDRVQTTLSLNNNVIVAFGVAEDLEAKEKVIFALLDEHEGKITYINVRVADRATYRAAE